LPTRKIELAIVVPGTTDLNKARDILKGILEAESRVLKDPAPSITIADASAAEIKYSIGAHVNNADMAAVQASLLENIKQALTAAGIWV
jgi:small conductance mechanosensitive channel